MWKLCFLLLTIFVTKTLSCSTHNDCSDEQMCRQGKCIDPCPGSCGPQTECHVKEHVPQCCCKSGYLGDGFTGCVPRPPFLQGATNACRAFPCGMNAQRNQKYVAAFCSCIPGFHGDPYVQCLPGAGCEIDQDCPTNKLCAHHKCQDPCHPDTCGKNTKCTTLNHSPRCDCLPGYEGDSLIACELVVPANNTSNLVKTEESNKCVPNPCGTFASCDPVDGFCKCPNGLGDPMAGCRVECIGHKDCPANRTCELNRCIDPCLGFCDAYKDCIVINRIPSCKSPVQNNEVDCDGFDGNPDCPKIPQKTHGFYTCPPPKSIFPCVCSIRRGPGSHKKDRGILSCTGPNLKSDQISRALTAFQNVNSVTKAVIILH